MTYWNCINVIYNFQESLFHCFLCPCNFSLCLLVVSFMSKTEQKQKFWGQRDQKAANIQVSLCIKPTGKQSQSLWHVREKTTFPVEKEWTMNGGTVLINLCWWESKIVFSEISSCGLTSGDTFSQTRLFISFVFLIND